MPRHDLRCLTCGGVEEVVLAHCELSSLPACSCGGKREIKFSATPFSGAWCDADAVVVYENPKTGKISYPGRNDVPMPSRLAEQGYERKEMRSLRQVEAFEKEHKVINEAMHYDRGSGRGAEDGS